jgi:hypothetical protein
MPGTLIVSFKKFQHPFRHEISFYFPELLPMNPVVADMKEQLFSLPFIEEAVNGKEELLISGIKPSPIRSINQYLKSAGEMEAELCYKAIIEQMPFYDITSISLNTDGYKNIHIPDDLSSEILKENY